MNEEKMTLEDLNRDYPEYAVWFQYSTYMTTIGYVCGPDRTVAPTLPPFQRDYVWTREQQDRLIQSIWGGIPIGSYVLNLLAWSRGGVDTWLIDGQQRIGAIEAYTRGDFAWKERFFPELPGPIQRKFLMTTFPCLQTRIKDEVELERIYNLLAYGGTPHAPKPLEVLQCSEDDGEVGRDA